jgi:subtilisin family serine protease
MRTTARTTARTIAHALSISIALAAAGHARAGGDPNEPVVPGELIVRADAPATLAAALAALDVDFANVAVIDQIAGRPIYLVSYALTATQTPGDVSAVIDDLIATGTIPWGELNYIGQTGEGKTDSLWLSGVGFGAQTFANQYAVPLLGIELAHERSRGAGVVVAVIDTGVDPLHPALGGRVSPAGASFVPGSASSGDIGDGIDNDGDGLVDEQVGHGTFVAGLVHLVAPEATILPVRVLDSDGSAGTYQIARALAWAIDRGAHIANMSLGETYRSQALEDVVGEAETRGIAVFGAAGNSNTDDPREFPACDGAATGVSALDWNDVKAPFSSFGIRIDLAAPGHTRLAKGAPDPTKSIVGPLPGGGYGAWMGTSFATAFTSGTAALVRAQHPEWPTKAVPASTIRARLTDTLATTGVAIDATNPAFAGLLGSSRISALGAVEAGPIAPPLGDLDLDGDVTAADLSLLLEAWGPAPGGHRADLDASGDIGAADLSLLLYAW